MAELVYKINNAEEYSRRIEMVKSASIKALEQGKAFEIALRAQEGKRSGSSNAKFHAMIADINRQAVITMPGKRVSLADYDSDTCKALLVIWFAKERELNGEPLRKAPRTEIDPMSGERISIRPSTPQWGVKDTSDFIEFLYSLGATSGVQWSEPAMREYESYKELQQ